MNAVRKHLSGIKGGRLAAAAAPARVVTLAISDVPGDDPAVIGSGLTVPGPQLPSPTSARSFHVMAFPPRSPWPLDWRTTTTRRQNPAAFHKQNSG